MSYTKGPWQVDLDGAVSAEICTIYNCPPLDGQGWRYVRSAHWVGDDESEANARLISAAPDMAEALQRLIAVYSSSYSPKDRANCWDQARAALAKAGL